MGAVGPAYQRFVAKRCDDDGEVRTRVSRSMTRYVSWDYTSPTKDALRSLLGAPVHEALESGCRRRHAREERRSARAVGGGDAASTRRRTPQRAATSTTSLSPTER